VAAGIDFSQIATLAVSHIHLDHAGGAGVLVRDHPHLRLAVHPVGAPHMANPAKLVASAARIYTSQMESLWGEIVPIPADRIDTLEAGSRLRAGSHELDVGWVLGHASHHITLFDTTAGVLFTGDAAGVRIQGCDHVGAATPPPEFDPEAWEGAIVAMKELGAVKLATTHADAFDDVDRHLDAVMPSTWGFVDVARRAFREVNSYHEVIAALEDRVRQDVGGDESVFAKYELADPAYVSAMGLERYLRKRGEPTIAPS
jgi:glyoxylase-like metal-dependent hydrolase (beta-lactamase superfamily II)